MQQIGYPASKPHRQLKAHHSARNLASARKALLSLLMDERGLLVCQPDTAFC